MVLKWLGLLAVMMLPACSATNVDIPPPTKPGSFNITLTVLPLDQIPAYCHHPYSKVQACTNLVTREIVLPLPQDYLGDYAYLVQYEVDHLEGWPDPPDVKQQLITDETNAILDQLNKIGH